MAKTQFLYMYIVKPYYVLIYDQTWYPYEGLKIIKHHSRMGVGGGVIIIQYTPLRLCVSTKMMGLYSCA